MTTPATEKRSTTKKPAKPRTTSQKVLDLPPPRKSGDFAYRIRQMNLDIHEDYRVIAQMFHLWMVHFMGLPTSGRTKDDWYEEVWRYLPESRWKKSRIQGFLFIFDDKRIWKLTTREILLTDPEAFVWLGNPNVVRGKGVVTDAIKWLKKRWKEDVYVKLAALRREFRRARAMQPKLYFANKSPSVRVVVYILDKERSNEELQKSVQYVTRNGCKRSTIKRTESGNYVEVVPQFP